jgi:hypothetical protein
VHSADTAQSIIKSRHRIEQKTFAGTEAEALPTMAITGGKTLGWSKRVSVAINGS